MSMAVPSFQFYACVARLESLRALEKQLSQLQTQCNGKHAGDECGILYELVAAANDEAWVCHD